MQVRVLGPLAVVDERGEVAVPGVRLRALLMLLAAHAGTDVTAGRLIDELWGEDPPKGASNALQVLVSKLRRVLGPGASALVTAPNGYRLELGTADVDWVRFESAVTRGRAMLREGDPVGAAEVLVDALALWRGAPFDGAADGVLHDAAVRLEAVRLNALEDRFDAELRAGRHFEVVEELRSVSLEHPLRERFHGLLMLALYRCGRQADALRAFSAARAVLLEELGVDPSPELRDLEVMILRHDPMLTSVGSEAEQAGFETNLPHPVGAFVGRVDELDELAALAERSRLVSVVAPGGAGKTRTSVEVARRWVDRSDVWFVDLAPLTRDGSVVDAVAATVGCDTGDGRLGSGSVLDRLVDHVARRPALMVVDNCEHVIQQAAFVVDRLVRDCGELRVLATSREALRVNGEVVWPLQPMTDDDGVALFVECARRTSNLRVDPDAEPLVAELCRRLDGIPLAIELAASRAGSMTIAQILDRLDDRFRVLTGGARSALPRQQTLRAVVEWSYQLLSDAERHAFDRLSVFAGGWSLDAAEEVVSDELVGAVDVADLLGQLVAKSLVHVDRSDGEVRYRMLHTLVLYGREQLASVGQLERFRRRHAAYFAGLCARGQPAFRGVDQLGWIEEVGREIDNLHEALSWALADADVALGQQMLAGLGPGWLCNGRAQEGWRWLRRGLDAGADSPVAVRAELATCASYLGLLTGLDPAVARDISELAVTLSRQSLDGLDGVDRLAVSLMSLGRRRFFEGDLGAARVCWTEAHELFTRSQGGWSDAMAAEMTGRLAALDGDVEAAYVALKRAIELCEADGIWWDVAVLASDVGLHASMLGAHADAIEIFRRGLRAAAMLRLATSSAVLTSQLAVAHLAVGDADGAERLSAHAVALAEEADTVFGRALALTNRARVAWGIGRTDLALDAARDALAVAEAAGTPSLARGPRQLIAEVTSTLVAEGEAG